MGTAHSADVRSVAFRPDGAMLASGSSDFAVKVWSVNAATGALTLLDTGTAHGH